MCDHKTRRRYSKYTIPLSNARTDGKNDFTSFKIIFNIGDKKIECYTEEYINMFRNDIPYDYSCCVYCYNGEYYVDNVYVYDDKTEKIISDRNPKNCLINRLKSTDISLSDFIKLRVDILAVSSKYYILPIPRKILAMMLIIQ